MGSERDWRPQVAGWARVMPECPEDVGPIRAIVTAAFGGSGEADLVDALRASGGLTFSLVARHDALSGPEAVLGHVAFSPVTINDEVPTPLALGLGPIAVSPDWQNQGIGSALVRAGLHVCRRRGVGLVFVLGAPSYYPRFGFEPAGRYGFQWDKANVGRAFQVAGLNASPGTYRDGGVVRYRPEFDLADK